MTAQEHGATDAQEASGAPTLAELEQRERDAREKHEQARQQYDSEEYPENWTIEAYELTGRAWMRAERELQEARQRARAGER